MMLGELLATRCGARGRAPAVVDLDNRVMTYDELGSRSAALAAALDSIPEPGVVLASLPNSIDAVVVVVGVLRSRHSLAFVHPRLPPAAVDRVIERLRPVARIDEAGDVRQCNGGLVAVRRAAAPGVGPPDPRLQTALYISTSGSTGTPRAIDASHHQVVTAMHLIANRLHYQPSDVIAAVPPLSFDYGLYQVLLAIDAGSTVLADPALDTVHGVVRAVGKCGVTVLPLVPPFLRLLLASPMLARVDTSAVRLVTTTGDALHDVDAADAARRFAAAAVLPMYGLSECKRVAITPVDARRPAASIGLPLEAGDVAIFDPLARRLAPCEAGELVVAGPHLTIGYLDDAEATRRRFPIDAAAGIRLLRTGDTLRMDDDGWLYWVGRESQLIKTSGFRLDASEVEAAVAASGVVVDVGVHGRPDDAKGQVPVAVAQVKPGIDCAEAREAIMASVAVQLPRWARPELHLSADPIPRTPNGKIDRRAHQDAPDDAVPDYWQPSTVEPLFPHDATRRLVVSRQFVNCHTQAFLCAFHGITRVAIDDFEILTTVPFGVRAAPDDPQRLLIPFLDPDIGLDRAATALGFEVDTRWFAPGAWEKAETTLEGWLRTGPVVVGPLDLGLLPYDPLARTLRGCDHYVVALGCTTDDFILRDPEGFVQVALSRDMLKSAWESADVPEGRGAFTLRRIQLRVGYERPSREAIERDVVRNAISNLLSAAASDNAGRDAYDALADLPIDATTRRAIGLLAPSTSLRYRLAWAFLRAASVRSPYLAELASAFEAQSLATARLVRAVTDNVDARSALAELARGEDSIARLAAGVPT